MDNIVTVSLGSNCGDRERMIRDAIEWLSGMMGDFHVSSIYETTPVGHAGENYYNAVACGRIHVSLKRFEEECKRFEIANGRDAVSRSLKLVPIDLDIVTSGGKVLRPVDYRQSFFQKGLRQLSEAGVIPADDLPQYLEAR